MISSVSDREYGVLKNYRSYRVLKREDRATAYGLIDKGLIFTSFEGNLEKAIITLWGRGIYRRETLRRFFHPHRLDVVNHSA